MNAIPDAGEVIARFRVDLGDSLAKISEFKNAIASLGETGGGGSSGGLGAMETRAKAASESISQLGQQLISTQAPMLQLAEHAQSISDSVGMMSGAFEEMRPGITQMAIEDMGASMQELRGATEDAMPLIPQFAESLHNVSEHTATASDNMAVLQDALQNPFPFSTIQQHLNETGQTWEDFNNSVANSGKITLDDIATNAGATHEVLKDAFTPLSQESANLMNSLPSVNAGMTELSDNVEKVGKSATSTFGEGGGFGGFGGLQGLFYGLGNVMMVAYIPQMIGSIVSGIQGAVQNITTQQAGIKTPEAIAYTAATNMLAAAQQVQTNAFDAAFGQAATPNIQRAAQFAAANIHQNDWLGTFLGTMWGSLVLGNTNTQQRAMMQGGAPDWFAPSTFPGAGQAPMITYADQLATNFAALNKVVQASPAIMQAQNDAVFAAMQHAPLAQQLVDIQSGAYQQAMMASTTRVSFGPPTFMGQFAPPIYAPPPQYAPPSPPLPQVMPYSGLSFAGIQLPDLSGIGAQLMSMFAGIRLPTLPDLGAGLGAQLAGMFAGITLPTIPSLGTMLSNLLQAAFGGITLPTLPHFATGVEGFGGGLAVVGEKGPELLSLPRGSSIYPGTSMPGGSSTSAQQTLQAHIYIGTTEIASYMAPLIVAEIRQQAGIRR